MMEGFKIVIKVWATICVVILMVICAPFVWIMNKIEKKFWNWVFK